MSQHRFDLFHWALLGKRLIWAYSGFVDRNFRDTDINSLHLGLWQLLRGGVVIDSVEHRLQAYPGDWILLPPGHHHQRFTDDAEILSIRFAFQTESHECLFAFNHPTHLKEVTLAFERSCQRLVRTVKQDFGSSPEEMRRMEASFSQHIRLETDFLDFLKHFLLLSEQQKIPLKPLNRLDPRVQRCIWEFKNNPMSHRFNEADLARFAGISVGQLNRLFQTQFGQTSGAWLKRLRLARARQLLSTSQPIKEVAYDLGFSSPQHFSSWFRKETNQSPSGWRKGMRPISNKT